MLYLVVNKSNKELLFDSEPFYDNLTGLWYVKPKGIYSEYESEDSYDPFGISLPNSIYRPYIHKGIELPKGTIEKLIGKSLTFQESPYVYGVT